VVVDDASDETKILILNYLNSRTKKVVRPERLVNRLKGEIIDRCLCLLDEVT
jgi:hypothetical protein